MGEEEEAAAVAVVETKPPCPPFNYQDAVQKVRMAEDAWNSRNPDKVCMYELLVLYDYRLVCRNSRSRKWCYIWSLFDNYSKL